MPHPQTFPELLLISTSPPALLNVVQVPLISPNIQSQLFPRPRSHFAPAPVNPSAIQISSDHLRKHGLLSATPPTPTAPAIDFTLPRLQGPTISHHFHAIGAQCAEPYLSLATSFASADLPTQPDKSRWVSVPGWTFYSPDGSSESVDVPDPKDGAMVFDVETLPFRGGHYPIMAVAVGRTGWYGWVSPWVTGADDEPNHLIPFATPKESSGGEKGEPTLRELGDERPRLLIGHHVLFDRARVATEYTLRRPSTRWLDTLSLHVAVSGLTNPQRPAWLKHRKELEAAAEAAAEKAEADASADAPAKAAKDKAKPSAPPVTTWKEVSSLNSLVEVARLHCGTSVDKSLRDVLVDPETTLDDVRAHFTDLIAYCAMDVKITLDVYRVLLPKFLKSCPHPASFAGVALMSQPILPVDKKWPEYLERAEETYKVRLQSVKDSLRILAEEARAKMDEKNAEGRFVWEDDLWLRQLDWSPKKARRLPGAIPAKKRAGTKLHTTRKSTLTKSISSPAWYSALQKDEDGAPVIKFGTPLATLLLETAWRGRPVVFTHSHGYLFAVSGRKKFKPEAREEPVARDDLGPKDDAVRALPTTKLFTVPSPSGVCRTLLGRSASKKVADGLLSSPHPELEVGVDDNSSATVANTLQRLASEALSTTPKEREKNFWLRQLDWTPEETLVEVADDLELESKDVSSTAAAAPPPVSSPASSARGNALVWPKWYWDLDLPGLGLEVSIKKRAAPLLLKLQWKGFPVVYSNAHRWIFRIPKSQVEAFLAADPSIVPLKFSPVTDATLQEDAENDAIYVKLPHPDGEGKNVGSPLSKPFVAAFEDKILTSEYHVAADALILNASCSYWASARERIKNQMVVWEGDAKVPTPTPAAIASSAAAESTQGLILPQVIPMGTVTRRAVEKTWLTAANAKKNRVGSELKSMVRAPPGYAIVGADVDSEELWICSVMGDAQFGLHGATAIGWMTLEGTKAAGTDLHSKTASILGITRDDAKVFNYSRIYGAGVKHAVQLLLKSNPNLTTQQATDLSKNLYAATKGLTSRGLAFGRDFWHGGTESFVFNKLEGIAHSDLPTTPALGCGLTDALKRKYLPAEGRSRAGEGYMPSRINWVVQSSGVDYLHLLIVSMEYLTKRFGIDARYMISVHDEVRYLVKEEDKYRAAMALQISNIWTRALFSFRLQIADLPQVRLHPPFPSKTNLSADFLEIGQSCAFFSAVDLDHCFRKEVNMNCLTPSNPDPILFGESLDIVGSLAHTSHGSLYADGCSMASDVVNVPVPSGLSDAVINGPTHRVDDIGFLVAQTLEMKKEVDKLWREEVKARRSPEEQQRIQARDGRIRREEYWEDRPEVEDPPPEPVLRVRIGGPPAATVRKFGGASGKSTPARKVAKGKDTYAKGKEASPKNTVVQLEEEEPWVPEEWEATEFDDTAAATLRSHV